MRGPSCGAALVVALVALVTKQHVRSTVAVMGEVDCDGNARKVGGLLQKSVAARDAGAKRVLLPSENEDDYKSELKDRAAPVPFTLVSDMWNVLEWLIIARQAAAPLPAG